MSLSSVGRPAIRCYGCLVVEARRSASLSLSAEYLPHQTLRLALTLVRYQYTLHALCPAVRRFFALTLICVSLICLCVQVFDRNGSFLSYVNTAAEPLYGPQGLAITSDGQIVVADSGNHCIKFYKYLQ